MTKPRTLNDGLPHRVYERHGVKTYSIGYKKKDGSWAFRLSCTIKDRREIQKLRRDATRRALSITRTGDEIETVAQLFSHWFKWQQELPSKSERKRAASTIAENTREAKTLMEVFGEMSIHDIQPVHAYDYLDHCDTAGRGPKGNKEIQLFQVVLQRAVRKAIIHTNPLREVEKLPTTPSDRYVENDELKLALDVGKKCGGQLYRASLALGIGYLCLRRSTEVLDADWSIVEKEGMRWPEGKTRLNATKKTVMIAWSDSLKELVDSLMKLDGHSQYPSSGLIFKTKDGQRYTRHGWKATLRRLMAACCEEAQKQGIPFEKFSLQDLRPKGVTDKLSNRHKDVQDATMHRSARMIEKFYDRRTKLESTPAR